MKDSSAKILVVEDDSDLQDAYRMVLESRGYTVKTASDGMQALNVLRTYEPSLILLDYLMPRMDGKNFLENFDKESHPDIKIILCSNIADQPTIEAMLVIGADEHILKSDISPIDLVKLVDRFI